MGIQSNADVTVKEGAWWSIVDIWFRKLLRQVQCLITTAEANVDQPKTLPVFTLDWIAILVQQVGRLQYLSQESHACIREGPCMLYWTLVRHH